MKTKEELIMKTKEEKALKYVISFTKNKEDNLDCSFISVDEIYDAHIAGYEAAEKDAREKAGKTKRRMPLQGDYYEGIRDRDTIDPISGLTWGEKYKRDLRRWESKNEAED